MINCGRMRDTKWIWCGSLRNGFDHPDVLRFADRGSLRWFQMGKHTVEVTSTPRRKSSHFLIIACANHGPTFIPCSSVPNTPSKRLCSSGLATVCLSCLPGLRHSLFSTFSAPSPTIVIIYSRNTSTVFRPSI